MPAGPGVGVERPPPRGEQTLQVVMHEIRQPLAAIFALAEAARTLPDVPADVHGHLSQIIDQANELAAAAGSVLEPPLPVDPAEPGRVDADEVIDSVLDTFRLTWTGSLLRHGDRGELPVVGSRAALRRCLVNLVDNAARAAGPTGQVIVTTHRARGTVRVLVEDDGPGFGHVAGRTGLGIGVTRQVLEAMGGGLAVGPPGRTGGAAVAVLLRAAADDAPGPAAPVRAG